MNAGRYRWRIALFIAIALAVLLIIPHLIHSREPRYEGHPVSYWFKKYCYSYRYLIEGPDEIKSKKALRSMGTKVLPYLVQQAFDTNEDSAFDKGLSRLLSEFPRRWHVPPYLSREDIQVMAPDAVQEINPPASAILPLITNELNQAGTPQHCQALRILAGMTNDSEMLVPYLAKILRIPDSNEQSYTLYALGRLGINATPAIPDITELLIKNGTDRNVCRLASGILAALGTNAILAIPALKQLFENETNRAARCAWAAHLYAIDPRQTDAFNYLTNSLAQIEDTNQIRMAALYLGRIGPSAKPVIPSLLFALNTTGSDAWKTVLKDLQSLEVAPELLMPKLRETLKSRNSKVRLLAAKQVLDFDKSDTEAQRVLVGSLNDYSEIDADAANEVIRALMQANPPIPEVLPALRAACKTRGGIRKTALEAIKFIESRTNQTTSASR